MAVKITFIGAGSIGFTRGLLSDILSVPELQTSEIAFMDINQNNLDMVTQLCQRDIDSNGLDIKIFSTLDRRAALKDANYVITCCRIGMLEAFTKDVEIPLKYGVDQCVGDTLCAGGIMYAQRDIAAFEGFCKDIREVAAPGCMMLNYANQIFLSAKGDEGGGGDIVAGNDFFRGGGNINLAAGLVGDGDHGGRGNKRIGGLLGKGKAAYAEDENDCKGGLESAKHDNTSGIFVHIIL